MCGRTFHLAVTDAGCDIRFVSSVSNSEEHWAATHGKYCHQQGVKGSISRRQTNMVLDSRGDNPPITSAINGRLSSREYVEHVIYIDIYISPLLVFGLVLHEIPFQRLLLFLLSRPREDRYGSCDASHQPDTLSTFYAACTSVVISILTWLHPSLSQPGITHATFAGALTSSRPALLSRCGEIPGEGRGGSPFGI